MAKLKIISVDLKENCRRGSQHHLIEAMSILYDNAVVRLIAGSKESHDRNQGEIHALEEVIGLIKQP